MRADEQPDAGAPARHDFARGSVQHLEQERAGTRAQLGGWTRARPPPDQSAAQPQRVLERRHDLVHEIVALETPLGGGPGLEVHTGAEEQPDDFGARQVDVRATGHGDAVVAQQRRQSETFADGAGQQ